MSARRLFVSLMSNSAFNKTEHFFVGIKSFLLYCIRRYVLIYLIMASYVPQGGMSMSSFEQTAEAGMLSNAGQEEEVVKSLLAIEATAKEEVVEEPGAETEVEDNTYVGESRSVIIR